MPLIITLRRISGDRAESLAAGKHLSDFDPAALRVMDDPKLVAIAWEYLYPDPGGFQGPATGPTRGPITAGAPPPMEIPP